MKSSSLIAKCTKCGGNLKWSPKKFGLICDSCSAESKVTVTPESEKVFGMEFHIEEDTFNSDIQPHLHIKSVVSNCQSCGVTLLVAEGQALSACLYCGSTVQLLSETETEIVLPSGIIPLKLTPHDCKPKIKEWVHDQYLAPRKFITSFEAISLHVVFIPLWAFDYMADFHFKYKIEHRETDNDGKTRYYDTNHTSTGSVDVNDGVIYAGQTYSKDLISEALPFPNYYWEPYSTDYQIGSAIELSAMNLKDAGKAMKRELRRHLLVTMRRIGGNNSHSYQITSQNVSRQTYHYLYAPVLIGGLKYKEQYYPIVVNGVTGETTGRVHLSLLRIISLVLFSYLLPFFAFSIYAMFDRKVFRLWEKFYIDPVEKIIQSLLKLF